MSIAERAGRWSAAHWKTATIGWLALVALALAAGAAIGTRSLQGPELFVGESARAERMLADAGFRTPAGESVLVRSTRAAPGAPAFAAVVGELRDVLLRLPQVRDVRNPIAAKNGRSELVSFELRGAADTADARVQPVLDAVAAVERAHPGFTLQEVGTASANHAGQQVIERRPETAVLIVSQYVERTYAQELLTDGRGGVGYLLKDRIIDVGEFVEAVRRVAAGSTALDPEVVAQLLARRREGDPLERLTPRELEVLGLMAEGRSNAGIADALVLTVGAVEKHVASILSKLRLPPSESDHRRVLAVLEYLDSTRD